MISLPASACKQMEDKTSVFTTWLCGMEWKAEILPDFLWTGGILTSVALSLLSICHLGTNLCSNLLRQDLDLAFHLPCILHC